MERKKYNLLGRRSLIVGAVGILSAFKSYAIPFPEVFETSSLGGTNQAGAVIDGEAANHNSGFSVNTAGDVNGDGIDDFVIGAPFFMSPNPGHSYVVFGKKGRNSYTVGFKVV
ncbi:MAG: integrin alpha [Verrucomicrobiia bacterium]